MERYDPPKPPAPTQGLALSGPARLRLVKAYRFPARPSVPMPDLHLILKLMVEIQAARRDETPVPRKLARLLKEGAADRREAMHAVAATLPHRTRNVWKEGAAGVSPQSACFKYLEKLTMKSCRRDFG